MVINGKVIGQDGSPVSGASVQVVDNFAKALGEGVIADDDGRFILDSTYMSQGNYLLITSVGYRATMFQPLQSGNYTFELETKAEDLEEHVVTPDGKKNWWPWVLGAAAVYYFRNDIKKLLGL